MDEAQSSTCYRLVASKDREGVAWDNNSLARLEDTQHLPPDGYLRHEILEHNHDPHGENWSDVVSSALELWQEECGLQEGGKLLVMPVSPSAFRRNTHFANCARHAGIGSRRVKETHALCGRLPPAQWYVVAAIAEN